MRRSAAGVLTFPSKDQRAAVRAAGSLFMTHTLRVSLARWVLALLACTSPGAHAADPRSAQGKKDEESQRPPTREAMIFATIMRGIHW